MSCRSPQEAQLSQSHRTTRNVCIHIRRRVGTEVTIQLVDYCNSVLAALPQSTIEPLQRVQNTAARLIFNLGKREHVSPYASSSCTGYQFVTELPVPTSFALSCTTSTSESLRVIWPISYSLLPPEWRAPACALSLRQTATPHLGCSRSSESGLFPSQAQRYGTLSLPNYAPSLTLTFLKTS